MNSAELLLEPFDDVERRVVTETIMCKRHVGKNNTEISTCDFFPPIYVIIPHVLSNKPQTYRQRGLDHRFYFMILDILKACSGLFFFSF